MKPSRRKQPTSPLNSIATNPEVWNATRRQGDCYLDPDTWVSESEQRDGSWWPTWTSWLEHVSPGGMVPARQVEDGLGPAPGTYLLER
jgi:polyhydroxyalkanoate synthase